MDKANNILFDWLGFTVQDHSVRSIIDLLGLSDCNISWDQTYGVHGYHDRWAFDGININFNPFKDDMGIFVEFSGQGCRRFEESSTKTIMQLLRDLSEDSTVNFTRLDIAYDDYSHVLNLNSIIKDIHSFNFVSKFQNKSIRVEEHAGHVGQTIYLGSNRSAVMFRIYDKKFERDRDDLDHWVRFEIQLRQERAASFINQLLAGDFTIGQGFFGVVNNYIRFVTPSVSTTRRDRWKLRKYWTKFLQSLEKIHLYTAHNTDYNLYRTECYVHKQCSNSVECLINAKGVDKFLFDMIHDKPEYTVKYESIASNNNAILDFLRERGVLDV